MALRQELIVELARQGGLPVPGSGRKRRLRCPFHQDSRPSAFIDAVTNVFYCSVCCGRDGRGWTAKRFAEALGIPWPSCSTLTWNDNPPRSTEPRFRAADARRVWQLALGRALRDDDEIIHADREVYGFLRRRHLGESWDHSLFGTLGPGMPLPEPVSRWPALSYQLVVGLYDRGGQVAGVQARAVDARRSPKTRFPRGSRVTGLSFADAEGREVLNGTSDASSVVLAEGVTDFLMLATVSPVPVLAAPGVSNASAVVGEWARGRVVFIALDQDRAGETGARFVAMEVMRRGGRPVRVRWPRGANDACDALSEVGLDAITAFVRDRISRYAGH